MGSSSVWGKNRRVSNLCIFLFFFVCGRAWVVWLAGVLWDFPLLTPFTVQGGCYCLCSSFVWRWFASHLFRIWRLKQEKELFFDLSFPIFFLEWKGQNLKKRILFLHPLFLRRIRLTHLPSYSPSFVPLSFQVLCELNSPRQRLPDFRFRKCQTGIF